jgi:hypothetical protein
MKDMSPDTTTWIMIGTATIWLIWDVYLYAKEKETISEKMYKASKVSTIVPFMFGVLCGHWFW